MIKKLVILAAAVLLSACAAPQVTRTQALSKSADAPYGNILIVSLLEDFDTRRYLESAIVKELSERGITAVASTTMMNTKTPVTRETFLAMVEEKGSDSVLISQLISLETSVKEMDSRPEATYNVWPTYYYNVWNVELTEYVEPPFLKQEHTILLATQLYSVSTHEPVWAIQSKSKIIEQRETRGDVTVITEEAKSIARHMSKDGLLAR